MGRMMSPSGERVTADLARSYPLDATQPENQKLTPESIVDRAAREHRDGFSIDVAGDDEVDKTLAALEMAGEEVAAGFRPARHTPLAMAHGRLGHREAARRWLDQLTGSPPDTAPGSFWSNVPRDVLRREAEAVIRFDPVLPPDPCGPGLPLH